MGSEKFEFDIVSESALLKFQNCKKLSFDELIALTVRFPFYIQCISGKGDPDLPGEYCELQGRAGKTHRMIREIEQGVISLRSKMMEVTSDIPAHVLSPLNRIERNKQNPLRNKYALRLAALEGTLSQFPIPWNSFFYMLAGEERQRKAATFRDADRTIFGCEKVSQDSRIDAVILCHEAVHVTQDDAARDAITTVSGAHRYHERLTFLSQKKRVVLNAELPAYGTELQIMNYVLRGALQRTSVLSVDEAMKDLGAGRPDQQIVVKTLLRLARVFPDLADHEPHQPFPQSFVEEIINLHQSEDYEICCVDPQSGELKPL